MSTYFSHRCHYPACGNGGNYQCNNERHESKDDCCQIEILNMFQYGICPYLSHFSIYTFTCAVAPHTTILHFFSLTIFTHGTYMLDCPPWNSWICPCICVSVSHQDRLEDITCENSCICISVIRLDPYYERFKWMADPCPGLGCGRAQLMTCISNIMHYAYTMQLWTNGNVTLGSFQNVYFWQTY